MGLFERMHKFEFDYRLQITVFISACTLVTPMFYDSRLHGFIDDDIAGTVAAKSHVFYCIAFVCLAAFILRAWGAAYVSSYAVMKKEVHTEKLIIGGPYKYVRNPLYLADIIGGIAIAAAFPIQGFLIMAISLPLHSLLIAGYEEKQLLASHGSKYAAYIQKVWRFIPRITPFDCRQNNIECADVKPDFIDGILSNLYFIGLAAAFAIAAAISETCYQMDFYVYAISLSFMVAWSVFFMLYYHPKYFQ